MIRYGIIGCGMMGQEHLHNIALLPETQVCAIYEPNAAMARAAQSIAPQADMSSSLDDLLRRKDLDCLVIASPNHCHLDQLQTIAEQQSVPILVEKPLFTSADDTEHMLKFAKTYKAPVWVAMEYRYMPPIASFIEQADAVTGGIKMLTIREHRFPFLRKVGDWNRFNKNSGGTLVEKCCHFFDLMRLIMKSEPIRIMASAGQDVNHLDEVYNGQRSDILDNAYVIVDFENGSRAMLELSMFAEGSEYQEELSAVGAKGKIQAKVPGPGRFWPAHQGPAPEPKIIKSPRSPKGSMTQTVAVDPHLLAAGDHNGATFYQHEKFLNVVKGNAQDVEVSLEDGYKAVVMGLAAQESALHGRAVEFDM